MGFPFSISVYCNDLYSTPVTVNILKGLTIMVGPNGSGKTQFLRAIKNSDINNHLNGRRIRYLSAGRLSHLEEFRSDNNGYGHLPNYDNANFGYVESQYRLGIENSKADFLTLKIKPDVQIKVAERLRKLFKRDIQLNWSQQGLKATFTRIEKNDTWYSSGREASGLLHIVSILAALYDDEVGCLLIDEPEVSLHPQYQSFLYNEMERVAGYPTQRNKKIIFIATHSPEMIGIRKPQDLSRIVFFKDAESIPVQVLPDAPELTGRSMISLISRLGSEHKNTFFASKPLLVEGPSDAIICNALDEIFDIYLSAAGVQTVPIIGKGQIPIVTKLMRLIGKNPIVLTDLDSFADGLTLTNTFSSNEEANRDALKKGQENLQKFSTSVYSAFCAIVENHWDDIADKATSHNYWTFRDQTKNELTAKRRATLATILSEAEEEIKNWPNAELWISLKIRLISLFDTFELAGYFILRKSTIENYFISTNEISNKDKAVSAATQVETLFSSRKEYIESNYSDVLRALNFASTGPKVDEAQALSDQIVAVSSTILSHLSENTTDSEIKSLADQILGEKVSLIKISKVNGPEELAIRIELDTEILDVTGFPLIIKKNSNPIIEVPTLVKSTPL